MFWQTYKTTLKNLFRSVVFWLTVVIVILVALENVLSYTYGYYDMSLNETIYDTDPRFILSYSTYIKQCFNSLATLLCYAVPLFAAISTVLIVNRDYGDNFFEIEKAGGIKIYAYIMGRITALVSVCFLITLAVNFVFFHIYVFTRGGVKEMGIWEYIFDSTWRILLMNLCRALPCIIFFIGLTYSLGALFRSGIPAAIGGMGYALAAFAAYMVLRLQLKDIQFYFDYLSPIPNKLNMYLYMIGTEGFESFIQSQNTSLLHALVCIGIMAGTGALCVLISYLRMRKRTV